MTFTQAIRTCLVDKLFDYSGRAPRSEYWWFTLFQIIVVMVFPLTIFAITPETFTDFDGNNSPAGDRFEKWTIGLYYLTVIPMITVSVRRFHDLGLSGWWYIALFAIGLPSDINQDNMTFTLTALASWLLELVICIRKGTVGPNRFGQDPLKPDHVSVFE